MLYTNKGDNNMAKLIDNLTVSPVNNVLLFNDEIAIANYDPTKLNALVIVAGSKSIPTQWQPFALSLKAIAYSIQVVGIVSNC